MTELFEKVLGSAYGMACQTPVVRPTKPRSARFMTETLGANPELNLKRIHG